MAFQYFLEGLFFYLSLVGNMHSMDATTKFPLYLPGKGCEANLNFTMLVADLRNKQSTLALYRIIERKLTSVFEKVYETQQFGSFSDLAKDFINASGEKVDRIALAVPGPVILGKCETGNLPWNLDSEKIKTELDVEKVFLVNDMEATAYSLVNLEEAEVIPIHDSEKIMPGNVAILAPGNGLGEAGMFWDGEFLRPFATEGGHTEFSPRNEFEVELYKFLNKIYGIVSWENVLSKSGLYNVYRFMRDVVRHQETKDLMGNAEGREFHVVLAEEGRKGNSRLANITLHTFAEFLAREANYLALKLKATGGLVITGEIAAEIREFIDRDKFYSDFKISDKMENLLKDIPLYFIFNNKAILQGAAYYGAFKEK